MIFCLWILHYLRKWKIFFFGVNSLTIPLFNSIYPMSICFLTSLYLHFSLHFLFNLLFIYLFTSLLFSCSTLSLYFLTLLYLFTFSLYVLYPISHSIFSSHSLFIFSLHILVTFFTLLSLSTFFLNFLTLPSQFIFDMSKVQLLCLIFFNKTEIKMR